MQINYIFRNDQPPSNLTEEAAKKVAGTGRNDGKKVQFAEKLVNKTKSPSTGPSTSKKLQKSQKTQKSSKKSQKKSKKSKKSSKSK